MTIWDMCIACWIPKATNTHSEYLLRIAIPQQRWLHEHTSTLRYTYIACPVIIWNSVFTWNFPLWYTYSKLRRAVGCILLRFTVSDRVKRSSDRLSQIPSNVAVINSPRYDIWYIYILLQLGWRPVATIQLTFTYKQYTEYTEQNIHNNHKIEHA
jgi:hypothetical protein